MVVTPEPAEPVAGAARVLVLAGHGRYDDPWHDHAATSALVAGTLTGAGLDVQVRDTGPAAFDRLSDVDLLVVNSGHGEPGAAEGDEAWAAAHVALHRAVSAGLPVLGLHQAANTFADSPYWSDLLGGRWNQGTSMHPAYGDAVFDVAAEHPIVAGAREFRTVDERYCYLDVHPGSQVLLTHHHQGVDHPVVWVQQRGRCRVVYDGLGHDVAAGSTPARRELLLREVGWLLRIS